MKTLKIEIQDSEYCGLRQIAAKYGVTVRELLSGFVADATGSAFSGGSDERDRADEYTSRRFSDYINYSNDPEAGAERDRRFTRSERWYSAERRYAEYERQKRAARA